MHVTMISRYRRRDQEGSSTKSATATKTKINAPVVKYIREKSNYIMQCVFGPAMSNKEE